jgi:hypothetical protein
VAPVPPRQPGVHQPGDGAGAHAPRRRAGAALAPLLVAALAVQLADRNGVVGVGAVPELLAVGAAAFALFAIGGLGLTRLLLPAELRRYELLWVLPVGACAVAIALTILGFAQVPFKVSLAIVLAAGIAVAVLAYRRDGAAPALRGAGWPVYVALLLAAVSLIPLFRAGFVTVEGQGQDAHLAVGTAQFLQKHPPTAIAIEEPVDRVPLVWRSKQPIYYALAAVATLSGREVFETISGLAAMMLALACLGFFLIARELLRAPPWAALAGMALVGLNPMVLHTVMHPYFNQTWGFFAFPFAMVLAPYAGAGRRTRASLALLVLFLAVCGFAYPLALPLPLLVLAVTLWPERRTLSLRRLYRGRRSLRWLVPLGLILLLPIIGVIEKLISAVSVVFDPGRSLQSWGGDVFDYFPEPQFLGVHEWSQLIFAAPLLAWGAFLALRAAPRQVRLALLALFAFAVVFAAEFRLRSYGYYFHFKILAFAAPVLVVTAAAGFGRIRRGWIAVAALLLVANSAGSSEIGQTFDELPRATLQLREINASLPADSSIRIDIAPTEQNWIAYMLHAHPLCSRHPLLNTSYPHVRTSRKADYIVTGARAPAPGDAIGPPVRRLDAFTLYRQRPSVPGPENCSREMVQTVTIVPIS